LGALLDLALLAQAIEEEELYGPSVLLGEEGARMAKELASVIGLTPLQLSPRPGDLREAASRLERCGYAMRDRPDFDFMARRKAEYQSCVDAIAQHLGRPTSVLIRS
jgi:hypothetical protein